MSMPEIKHAYDATGSTLVVRRRRTGLIAMSLAALVVAVVAFTIAIQSSQSDGAGAVWALVCGAGVLSCIVFAVLAGRAGAPLLVVDATGVTTGRLPKVRLGWADVERIRVFEREGSGAAIGIFPRSLDDVAAGLFGRTSNGAKYAARLRSFAETKGAPIVVSLKSTSLDGAAATAAITAIAAGRTEISG